MSIMRPFVVVAALFLSAAAENRPTIRVEDGVADGAFLKPYANSWLYLIHYPDGRVENLGVWTDLLQSTTIDGRPAWLRVQSVTDPKRGSSSYFNVFDPKNMGAISSKITGPSGKILKRDFAGPHVVSTLTTPDGKSTTNKLDLPGPIFDFNGGMYGLIIASMPLRKGLSGTIPTIEEFDDKPSIDNFRVLRSENIRAGGLGVRRAWVVQSERPGKYRMTFWITKSPPYILKLLYEVPEPNSPYYTWNEL